MNEKIQYRDQISDLSGQNLEFYNWFNQTIISTNCNAPDSLISPFYFDIDWHSGSHFEYFGSNSLVYNVLNPIKSEYNRMQIVINKNDQGKYSAKMLFYKADSTYYIKNYRFPSIFNFTGTVLEVPDFKVGVDNIHFIYAGKIVKSIDKNQIDILKSNRLQLRLIKYPWVSCSEGFSADDLFHWLFDDFWDIIGDAASWGWNTVSGWCSTFGSYVSKSWGGGGDSGLFGSGWWWDTTNPNNSNGNTNGGNSSGSYGGWNNTTSNPWNTSINWDNYYCVKDNIDILKTKAPELFTDAFFYDPCLCIDDLSTTLAFLCAKNKNEISLNDDALLNKLISTFKERREKILQNAKECQSCIDAFAEYERIYGCKLDDKTKDEIIKYETNCDNKWGFNCTANKYLFFQRNDIKDIIANNSLIDPCNPSKSSEEILRDFANKNCRKDLSGKPLDAILSDIGEKGTVIWTSPNLLQYCPLYDCLWKNMLSGNSLETNLVCNLISPFEGSNNFKNIIIIKPYDFSTEQNPNALAKTDIQSGNIYILINQNRCTNRDTLEMFETIQHELIHATLLNELMNYFGFDGD